MNCLSGSMVNVVSCFRHQNYSHKQILWTGIININEYQSWLGRRHWQLLVIFLFYLTVGLPHTINRLARYQHTDTAIHPHADPEFQRRVAPILVLFYSQTQSIFTSVTFDSSSIQFPSGPRAPFPPLWGKSMPVRISEWKL